MRSILKTLPVIALFLASAPATAGEQTTTLKVDNMYCASCPFIVKQTLAGVDGVKNVKVSFRKKLATVTYDDKQCTVAQLAGAVTKAGFPATPVKR